MDLNQIWIPLYCKDYGAFARVEVVVSEPGAEGTPAQELTRFFVNLPYDSNGDRLAHDRPE